MGQAAMLRRLLYEGPPLALAEDLKREVEIHRAFWKKRLAGYQKVYEDASTVKSTTRALLSGEPEYKKLIQTEYLPPLLELPELEKSITSREKADEAGGLDFRFTRNKL